MIGLLFGGILGLYLLAALWEFLLYKRVMNDPLKGKMLSVVTAWITASGIAGFGFADGELFRWDAFGLYAVPSILLGLLAYHRGQKLRDAMEMDDGSEIAETFK